MLIIKHGCGRVEYNRLNACYTLTVSVPTKSENTIPTGASIFINKKGQMYCTKSYLYRTDANWRMEIQLMQRQLLNLIRIKTEVTNKQLVNKLN